MTTHSAHARPSRAARTWALAAVAALVAAGCGGGGAASDATDEAATPSGSSAAPPAATRPATTATTAPSDSAAPVLAKDGSLGVTRLAVRDIDRSIRFYQRSIGLKSLGRDGSVARLGVGGRTVLELAEEPEAAEPGDHAGLYHVALNYPSRVELARAVQRLVTQQVPIEGASDHGTHEAIYLPDPDGNGLELASDRPRDEWPDLEEEYNASPRPLDTQGLMALVDEKPVVAGAADGLVVGHLHLTVGDIDQALAFYRDLIGFEIQARLPTAAFVSIGGYHHHLGLNVWKGEGVPPAPDRALGMRSWTVQVPAAKDVDELRERLRAADVEHRYRDGVVTVRDPWNNTLRVRRSS